MVEKYVGPRVQELFGVSAEEFLSQGNRYDFHLQPLTKIHIDPTVEHDAKPASDPKYLIIFGTIAILIIVIASINFMNLATAQATKRAKEVGVKKVNGSSQWALVSQFLTDSTILALLALVVAVITVLITLPYFNNLLDAKIEFGLFRYWYYWPGLIAFAFVVGIFAGAYPAFYLSSFSPATVLREKVREGFKNGRLRSILVSVQFLISIVLIIGTIIMYRQLTYMVNKDMGWRSYYWDDIVTRAPEDRADWADAGLTVEGSVKRLFRNKPVVGGKVVLGPFSRNLLFKETKTDKNGRFKFDRLFLRDHAEIMINSKNERKRANTEIIPDPLFDPDSVAPADSMNIILLDIEVPLKFTRENYYRQRAEKDFNPGEGNILLEEVDVYGRKPEKDDGHYRLYAEADNSLTITEEDVS